MARVFAAARAHVLVRLAIALALVIGMWPAASPAFGAARSTGIPPSYRQVAENASFRLYVDFATLGFKVVDKRNGYVWHATLDEKGPDDRLNRSWLAFAQSGISIEYLDQNTISKAVSRRASITNAEHALDVQSIAQGIAATIRFTEFGITIGVNVRLETDGVSVEVPFGAIRQDNPNFRLGLLYVYPFLGATRGSSVPGYFFLPDGVGSLIHFADSTKARNMFYGRYYGTDLGMVGALPLDPTVNRPYLISLPVFGMVHGEGRNAFLAVVERGAPYAELHAHPAGIITNFNFAYNAFIYNESYFQATNRSGAGVITLQPQTNAFDVTIRYRFLAGADADYVGMARSYRAYLVERGALQRRIRSGDDIGIRLEFLGGDKEKILLWHRFVPMTTFRQARQILAGLDVGNPEVIYYGWQPLGASSMPPTRLAAERALGGLDELRALAQDAEARGGRLLLYLDPQAALANEPGYSPRYDLALAITSANIKGFNRNKENFYLHFDALQRRYIPLAEDVERAGFGLALDGIGSTLYSDFTKGRTLDRERAAEAYRLLLARYPMQLGFYRPNAYVFELMHAYYDLPLDDNGYTYTHETVPFLPIVLAGLVPYYGSAFNFSPNMQEDILRHVDYGAYPSYFLTHEPTANMLNTSSNWIYTSSYAQWGEPIRRTYRWMNALLGPVRGQEIVARRKLAEGVFATSYANGKHIIVNYSAQPFTHHGETVGARDAALWEALP
ncbi:MAG: DUF5696 domain-containing protein [Anaerolineae bacterium]|nr:DUF5696 domain-containing protein [Candidatus Roseilinea sp.]MDW8451733.1 DUF5696 domain-containing protein [Anaerolineae bacterium]